MSVQWKVQPKSKKCFVVNQIVPWFSRFVAGLSLLSPEASQALPWLSRFVAGLSLLSPEASQAVPWFGRFVAGLSLLSPEASQAVPWFSRFVAGLSLLRPEASQAVPWPSRFVAGLSLLSPEASQAVPWLSRFVAGLSLLRPEASQAVPWLSRFVAGLSLRKLIFLPRPPKVCSRKRGSGVGVQQVRRFSADSIIPPMLHPVTSVTYHGHYIFFSMASTFKWNTSIKASHSLIHLSAYTAITLYFYFTSFFFE